MNTKSSFFHASTLVKYIGISFITGAISHGFFSGSRQLLTALFGIGCFTLGVMMERSTETNARILLLSTGLALGIGAVTGGLQHFPDSPERSIFIVPIGFLASLIFFVSIEKIRFPIKYAISGTLFSLVLSLFLYFLIENISIFGHTHH